METVGAEPQNRLPCVEDRELDVPALPVLLLTGFLGAGKTTVLNSLLANCADLRVGVVMNDFGDLAVDALNIATKVDDMISLTNGCVCCEIDGTDVSEHLLALADPERNLDLVVIEASGLAEPALLARVVRDSPSDAVEYAGSIYLVDGMEFDKTLDRQPQLYRHLASADLIAVSKCDVIGQDAYRRIKGMIGQVLPGMPILPVHGGWLDPRLLIDGPRRKRQSFTSDHFAADDGTVDGGHLHDSYVAVTVDLDGPLHPRRLLDAARNLAPGVVRVKGIVEIAEEDQTRRYELSMVGSSLTLRALLAADFSGDSSTDVGLVLIGVGLTPLSGQGWLDAVVYGAEAVKHEDAYGLFPYIQAPPGTAEVEEWIYDEARNSPSPWSAHFLCDPEDPESGDPAFTP